MKRTLAVQATQKIEKIIKLQGWVDTIRNHGKLIFIELRDRSGKIQVVGEKKLMGKLHPEYVVEIIGKVVERPQNMINKDHITGKVEIQIEKIKVLNSCDKLPFPINTNGKELNDELRLKYRYLDLRRERMNKIIRSRSNFVQACREYLLKQDFVEIETPMLTKATKEGSRDFIVPSRLQPGKFFALPQSPQQYKQMLMTGGFERYFQLARCIRDEDLRADRGFEHTQIDIEMSFVERDDVLKLDEEMIIYAIEKNGGKIKQKPFPRITHAEAMKKYGADRFDDRTENEKKENILSFYWVIDFPMFKKVDTNDAAEVRDGKSGWTFEHNPFCSPKKEDIEKLLSGENIGSIKAQQYDLICNGYEVGGGSIRAHEARILKATYRIMGYNDKEIEDGVGHMLKAFKYGTPPHGGLAHGVERLVMILNNEEALREVQAFPQTSKGNTSVVDAPNPISDDQLKELGIKIRGITSSSYNKQSILERIKAFLKEENIKYKEFHHKPVYTSKEAAEIRGVQLNSGAKALILKTDKGNVMAVISAIDKLNSKAFRKNLGYKRVSFVDKETLKKLTGLEPGAVPPFGKMFGLKVYVDRNLTNQEFIDFNAGTHTDSIEIKTTDYLEIEKPEIVDFSK